MTDPTARAEVYRTRDLAGWDVTDREGTKIGDLSDLLIGSDGRVRFLAVNLGLFRKHVLVPASAVEWGRTQVLVVTPWTAAEVKELPAYDDGIPLTEGVLEEMTRAHPRYYGGEPLDFDDGGDPRILPLREAREFRLPKGAPDVTGWTVFAGDNERVGTVAGMLVDPVAMKIRYLAVDLADDLFNLKEDRHVLIPLESVELRERGQDVWVRDIGSAEIATLPAYTGGAVRPWLERATDSAFRLGDTSGPALPRPSEDELRPVEELPPPLEERPRRDEREDSVYDPGPPPLP
jgi:sporulation protein YlmC with PRC-barrel domain